jgi:hypothetical protein
MQVTDYLDWEFLLEGDTQEFRNLISRHGTRLFNLYGDVDEWLDCPNDDFRMTTLYSEGETDSSVIWQVGYELISLFNGASVLFRKDYRRASIYKLLHNGLEVRYLPPQGTLALLGRPNCSDLQLAEEFLNAKRSSIKFQLIHLATENQVVYFILKYLDMEASWATYYKLLESLEQFAKKNALDLGIGVDKRRSFRNTANTFSLSGFDSRHGFKELTKKNNTASMTIHEGHRFVTDTTKKYLGLMYIKKT